jgi:hypothetical protein
VAIPVMVAAPIEGDEESAFRGDQPCTSTTSRPACTEHCTVDRKATEAEVGATAAVLAIVGEVTVGVRALRRPGAMLDRLRARADPRLTSPRLPCRHPVRSTGPTRSPFPAEPRHERAETVMRHHRVRSVWVPKTRPDR